MKKRLIQITLILLGLSIFLTLSLGDRDISVAKDYIYDCVTKGKNCQPDEILDYLQEPFFFFVFLQIIMLTLVWIAYWMMGHLNKNSSARKILLKNLVQAKGDSANIEKQLSNFDWEYEGEPVLLSKRNVKNTLLRYIRGELTAQDVYQWAEILELREDIDYPAEDEVLLSEIMHSLANPALEGELTMDEAMKFIGKMGQV